MLYEVAKEINKYFDFNWMQTPIQYDGINFKTPDDGIWISIKLVPYERTNETLGTGVTMERGLLKVFSYSQSATLSYQLAQEVSLFIEQTVIDGAFIDVGSADGNGAINLHDDIYETLTNFNVMLSQQL